MSTKRKAKQLLIWKYRDGTVGEFIGAPARVDAERIRRKQPGARFARYRLIRVKETFPSE